MLWHEPQKLLLENLSQQPRLLQPEPIKTEELCREAQGPERSPQATPADPEMAAVPNESHHP